MIGQKKSYSVSEKKSMMEAAIKKQNPCAPSKPLNMDLRGLYAHIKKNNLSNKEITTEILEKFSKI